LYAELNNNVFNDRLKVAVHFVALSLPYQFLQLSSQHCITSCTPSHVYLIPVFFVSFLFSFADSNADALIYGLFGIQAKFRTSFTDFCIASFSRNTSSCSFSDFAGDYNTGRIIAV